MTATKFWETLQAVTAKDANQVELYVKYGWYSFGRQDGWVAVSDLMTETTEQIQWPPLLSLNYARKTS